MVLLQELEKQKVKLEQMLLEAQQEREHLKAAAGTQEVDLNQSDVTDQDQEVASAPTGPATEVSSVLKLFMVLIVLRMVIHICWYDSNSFFTGSAVSQSKNPISVFSSVQLLQ